MDNNQLRHEYLWKLANEAAAVSGLDPTEHYNAFMQANQTRPLPNAQASAQSLPPSAYAPDSRQQQRADFFAQAPAQSLPPSAYAPDSRQQQRADFFAQAPAQSLPPSAYAPDTPRGNPFGEPFQGFLNTLARMTFMTPGTLGADAIPAGGIDALRNMLRATGAGVADAMATIDGGVEAFRNALGIGPQREDLTEWANNWARQQDWGRYDPRNLALPAGQVSAVSGKLGGPPFDQN